MAKRRPRRSRAEIEADLLEKSYRSVSSVKSGKKKKANHPAAIIAICIALIVIAVGITLGCIYISSMNQDGVILHNVTVAGVDVGGMTQAEAINAVKAVTANTYTKQTMVVNVFDSQAEIPPGVSDASLNVRAAVRAAFQYGRSGTSTQQQTEQEAAMAGPVVIDISKHLHLDEKAIKNALSEIGVSYSSVLSQSSYEVTGSAPDQTLVVHLGVPEYGLDMEALYQQVLDAYNRNQFEVVGECGIIEPAPIDLESILAQYYIAPIDARLDLKTHEIVEGTDGYGFDIEKARNTISQAKYGTDVVIPFENIKPEITAENLNSMLYRDELATYTAANTSKDNRDTNLRLACEAINGLILYPGDMFSYNSTLGERTTAKGYKPGLSYSGNESVETVGGGICQVSSTLYYCALLADLEILSRNAHGFATSYMPLGMDATVSWGSLDFRFRNNTDYPIRIEANASGGNTTIKLLGTDVKDYYVKMEYEVLATYNFTTTYKTMEANNPQGYRNGDYITEPYTGYDINTYRCKYSKADDSLISREFEATSNYRRRDGVICRINGASSNGTGNSASLPGIGNGSVTEGGDLPPDLP